MKLSALKNYLKPPEFDDLDRTRQAQIMHMVIVSLMIVIIFFEIVYGIQDFSNISFFLDIITFTLLGLSLYFLHQGHLLWVKLLFVPSVWILYSVAIYLTGGVDSPLFITVIALIIITTMFAGGQWGIVASLYAVLFEFVIYNMGRNGLLPDSYLVESSTSLYEGYAYQIILTGVLLYFIWSAIQNVIQRAYDSEVSMRKQKERANMYFDTAALIMLVIDRDGQIVKINAKGCEILGYTREELIGKPWIETAVPIEERAFVFAAFKESIDNTENVPEYFENHIICKDGLQLMVEWFNRISYDDQGKVQFIISAGVDVTDRKKVEQNLEKSREALQTLIENMEEGLYRVDSNGAVIFINKRGAEICGYDSPEEMLGKNAEELGLQFSPSRRHMYKAMEGKNSLRNFHSTMINARNEKYHVIENVVRIKDAYGNAIGIEGTMLDITEQKNLESQLIQSQKMEAIGRLAGGVAHDFNNLLTVIQGYGDMALSKVNEDNPIYKHLKQIQDAGKKAEALTNQLLTFSRKQVIQPEDLNLNLLIGGLHEMLHRMIGEDVALNIQCASESPFVRADANQIEQVLMNLAVNARDAMPDGGTLTIETENISVDKHLPMDRFYLKEGNYLVLAVSDTGTGIDKDMLQYIYEPFFTTKEKGKGTGLGLATVYAIIKQNGGHINVYSEKGEGTVFKIYLPVIDAKQTSVEPAKEIPVQAIQGNETLLIVEDEESVLEYVSESLAEYGYEIMGAINPVEAINIYRNRKSHIDMIISDVIMPHMSGPEMVRKLRVDAPDLKILFMSGYTESMIGKHGVLDQEIHYIQKPFGPNEIARKIRETLDQQVKAYS